jgi:hypothetical protein
VNESTLIALINHNGIADIQMTGAKRLYSNYIEMMDREQPDIAVLCSCLPQGKE